MFRKNDLIKRNLLLITIILLTACTPQVEVMPTMTSLPSTDAPQVEPTLTSTPGPLTGKIWIGDSASGQYKLEMSCKGQGSPTVVLDSGPRGEAQWWSLVKSDVASFTQVCSYHRTGNVSKPLTVLDMVNDLHAVLAATGVEGPYVLVGQSFAGMKVRMYAYQFPGEVVGMVLVDPDHEEAGSRDAAVLPPESPDESDTLKEIRKELANPGSTQDPTVNHPETIAQMRAANSPLGNMPLIVLTAGVSEWPPDLEPEVGVSLTESWRKLHDEIALLSSDSIHIIVGGSGHNIHVEKPEVVTDAINKVVEAVRAGTPLPR